jgi:hypothetical protein
MFEILAEYKTVMKYKLETLAVVKERIVPAQTATINKQVIDHPASVRQNDVAVE